MDELKNGTKEQSAEASQKKAHKKGPFGEPKGYRYLLLTSDHAEFGIKGTIPLLLETVAQALIDEKKGQYPTKSEVARGVR